MPRRVSRKNVRRMGRSMRGAGWEDTSWHGTGALTLHEHYSAPLPDDAPPGSAGREPGINMRGCRQNVDCQNAMSNDEKEKGNRFECKSMTEGSKVKGFGPKSTGYPPEKGKVGVCFLEGRGGPGTPVEFAGGVPGGSRRRRRSRSSKRSYGNRSSSSRRSKRGHRNRSSRSSSSRRSKRGSRH